MNEGLWRWLGRQNILKYRLQGSVLNTTRLSSCDEVVKLLLGTNKISFSGSKLVVRPQKPIKTIVNHQNLSSSRARYVFQRTYGFHYCILYGHPFMGFWVSKMIKNKNRQKPRKFNLLMDSLAAELESKIISFSILSIL